MKASQVGTTSDSATLWVLQVVVEAIPFTSNLNVE